MDSFGKMKQENRLRRLAFDREAGVAIAQALFHEHGYDAVSIADLTQALNIKQPGIQIPDCSTIIMGVHTKQRSSVT